MLALKRHLYQLILRLHPAAFRARFAREMSLDFEDALAAYGFSRLLADAMRSLFRQWIAPAFSAPREQAPIPSRPLLAGNYAEMEDEPMRPLELLRGFIASATLLVLCGFAFNASSGHIPQLGVVYAAYSNSLPSSPNVPLKSASPRAQTVAANSPIAHQVGSPLLAVAAQSAAAAERPLAFEVVSIREDKSLLSPQNPVHIGPTRDGYHIKGLPLTLVIRAAFAPSSAGGSVSFGARQISGVPAWLSSTPYDIDARIPQADLPRWNDPAQQPAMLRSMLQGMLADRFKLIAHIETKDVPIYELTVGSHGPKFKPSRGARLSEIRQKYPGAVNGIAVGGAVVAAGPQPNQQMIFGVTIPDFCNVLSALVGRPVRDKTGLTGAYDITYQLEPPSPPQQGAATAAPSDLSSQIYSVVEDQLGLKLTSTKGPAQFLVIDHIEKPSEN